MKYRLIVWGLVVSGVMCTGQRAGAADARQPDAFGGYASTHVVVRVCPSVAPVERPDGRLALTYTQPGAPRGAQAEEDKLATTLARWDVSQILPTADPPPANQALARQLGLDRYYTIRVPAGTDTPALVNELQTFTRHIEVAEVDGIGGLLQTFPNDQHFGVQYGMHNTGQNIEGQVGTADADLDAPEAWDLHPGTDDITIAIIDTGVSLSHSDLTGKLVTGRNFYNTGSGGDGNYDDSWLISHGSHCAGIAAAMSNNGIGVCGVSWGARIMPIKVLNVIGMGDETDCANGVIWAADHGANVGSMSLGYPDGITYFENAINYAHGQGMVLVAATGNTPGDPVSPPARWENVIAVGATDNRDNLASFTTTGPEMSVSAPGVDVYSTWDVLFDANSYSYQSGTSMACPHVAGLAALVWSANLSLTNDEVRAIIEGTADDLGTPGWDTSFGYGRVNAYAAVATAMGPSIPGDFDRDGDVDLDDYDSFADCFTGPDGGPVGFECQPGDFDEDGDVDCVDWAQFALAWTGPGDPPDFPACTAVSPAAAAWPHNARKNRCLSFVPNNTVPVAFEVELTASEYFPGSVGSKWWVSDPVCTDPDGNEVPSAPPCAGDNIWRAPLVSTAPPARLWIEDLVHVADCRVVPVATYAIRATLEPQAPAPSFSADLEVGTILRPGTKFWGDCVGEWDGGQWTLPNQVVNMDDVMAAVFCFADAPNKPHRTWVEVDDEGVNMVLNFTDILRIVQGFKGEPYPFSAPADCP